MSRARPVLTVEALVFTGSDRAPKTIEEAAAAIADKITSEASALALAGFTVIPALVKIEPDRVMPNGWLNITLQAERAE